MRKTVMRICGMILCICMLLESGIVTFAAEDNNEEGFITIGFSDNSVMDYSAKIFSDEIYLSAEDIAEITGYRYEIGEFMVFTRPYEQDYVTSVSVEFNGKAETMGRKYQVGVIECDGTWFLPLEKMMYLLHAAWCVENNVLYVQQMQKTILDFVSEYQLSLLKNRTSQGELLLNGENKFMRVTRSTLAHVVRNFDARLYVPVAGALILEEEQYEKILMELAEEDTEFLGEAGQKKIEEALNEGIFSELSGDLGKLEFLTGDIPQNADNLQIFLEEKSESSKIAEKISRNVNFSDLTVPEIQALSEKLNGISDITSAAIAAQNIVKAAKWAGQAEEEVLQEIAVLSDFDDISYHTFLTNPMKQAAKNLLNRKQAAGMEIADDILMETISFLGEKAAGATFTGTFIGAVQMADMLGGYLNDSYHKAMETAELSFCADYLIKTESVALNEELRAYQKVISGNFSAEELQRLRNAFRLSLRLNLRAKANIYYINVLGNKTEGWEEGEEAQRIRQLIADDYAMLAALKSTETEDNVLILEDFSHIYQDGEGITREKIPLDQIQNAGEHQDMGTAVSLEAVYETYAHACDLTTADGNWTENTDMMINMDISNSNTKGHYTVEAGSDTEVSGYQKEDVSALKLQGTGYMNFANVSYIWNMNYADGTAHYDYEKPDMQSAELEVEPQFFDFYDYGKEMWKSGSLKKNQILFTLDGSKMSEKGLGVLNSVVRMEELNYSDICVMVTLSEDTGGIEEIQMDFQAALKFQGYDADAEYKVTYHIQN